MNLANCISPMTQTSWSPVYLKDKRGLLYLSLRWDHGGFLVAQIIRNLSAMQETWIQSLGREDPLQKVMATHSSILA